MFFKIFPALVSVAPASKNLLKNDITADAIAKSM